jgi:predicted PurR-regulated permease PerM
VNGAETGVGRVRPFVLILLAVVLGLVLLLLWRFLTPIVLAVLLALLAFPFFRWFQTRLGMGPNVAALTVVFGTFFLVVVPVSAFLFLLFTQGANLLQDLAARLEEGGAGTILEMPILQQLQALVNETIPQANLDGASLQEQLAGLADSAVEYLVSSGVTVFGNIADVIAKFFILLFLLFYLVRDGDGMVARLRELLPLSEDQTTLIFSRIRDVTRAVVFGTLAIAALQGVLGGIGLWIVGLPGLVWGTVIGVSSLIPVVGTALVTVPALAYLLFNGLYWQSAFFAVWASVLVGGVDNYLRPFFMQGQARMSAFYIFLAIIGGLATFGISGLIFGPLIVAIAIVVIQIYGEEYAGPRSAPGSGRSRTRHRAVRPHGGRPGWTELRAFRRGGRGER